MRHCYLDYAATTPVRKEVIEVMTPYFSLKYGNPSSLHYLGREAKDVIEKAREDVAYLINAKKEEIVFTSSGTEANNFALQKVITKEKSHIIVSEIEHPSVIETCKFLEKCGHEITFLKVDNTGKVSPQDVEREIKENTVLVSIMHANNEIGTIQPIEQIGLIIKKFPNVYFHVDAVQSAGLILVDVNLLNVDFLTISSHKLYGPKGVGALFIKKGTSLNPMILGGGQENKKRASTENVPGIVGFGKACKLAKKDILGSITMRKLRDRLENLIINTIADVKINGHLVDRLPNNLNVSVKNVEGEAMLLYLDMEQIAVSTGSACSSLTLRPSHVLLSIGLSPEQAHGSIRFSLGKYTTEEDIDYVAKHFANIVSKLREMSALR